MKLIFPKTARHSCPHSLLKFTTLSSVQLTKLAIDYRNMEEAVVDIINGGDRNRRRRKLNDGSKYNSTNESTTTKSNENDVVDNSIAINGGGSGNRGRGKIRRDDEHPFFWDSSDTDSVSILLFYYINIL